MEKYEISRRRKESNKKKNQQAMNKQNIKKKKVVVWSMNKGNLINHILRNYRDGSTGGARPLPSNLAFNPPFPLPLGMQF